MKLKEMIDPRSKYLTAPQTGVAFTIRPPLSKAGDFIEMRAEMDLIIGLTACSAGKCNNFRCTPIKVEVHPIIAKEL